MLSVDLVLNLFAADTPLHDGALLVRGSRILSAGVILPLSRQGITRYGTRHLAALGITERFDRCLCIVVSEETGTLSLARQGKLERPITSSRLRELLTAALAPLLHQNPGQEFRTVRWCRFPLDVPWPRTRPNPAHESLSGDHRPDPGFSPALRAVAGLSGSRPVAGPCGRDHGRQRPLGQPAAPAADDGPP